MRRDGSLRRRRRSGRVRGKGKGEVEAEVGRKCEKKEEIECITLHSSSNNLPPYTQQPIPLRASMRYSADFESSFPKRFHIQNRGAASFTIGKGLGIFASWHRYEPDLPHTNQYFSNTMYLVASY